MVLLPAAALVCGIAAGLLFVRRQRRLEQPLLDLRLFTDRTFSSALTLTFVTALVGAGTLLLVNVHLQNVTGLTPLEAGLVLLVPNVLMVVGTLATPPLANRIRPARLIAGGLVVAGAGYAIFTVAASTSGPQAIFVAMCVVMVGTAPLAALCNQLGMGAVPPDKAGSGAPSSRRPSSSGSASGSPRSPRSAPPSTAATWRTRSGPCRPTQRTPPGRASTAPQPRQACCPPRRFAFATLDGYGSCGPDGDRGGYRGKQGLELIERRIAPPFTDLDARR